MTRNLSLNGVFTFAVKQFGAKVKEKTLKIVNVKIRKLS